MLEGLFGGEETAGNFGVSVGVSGGIVVIGAPMWGANNDGAAFGYSYQGPDAEPLWSGPHQLTGYDVGSLDNFGSSVAVDGDRIVVGSIYDDDSANNAGAVYCFQYCGLDGDEVYKLLAYDGAANDLFGSAVAVSGDFAIIGAPFDDGNYDDMGSAYIFDYADDGLLGDDEDEDGVADDCDNCPDDYNPCQVDCDDDGVGDVCAIANGWTEDCNENEISDDCDIAWGLSEDCNYNGVPDECELADPNLDCDQDGVLDECQVAPLVDLVFVLDCSSSMDDDADDLCSIFLQEIEDLRSDGIQLNVWFLGIDSDPDSRYACLFDSGEYYSNVVGVFGVDVPDIPGDPPASPPTCCDKINQEEDWGPGLAIVGGLLEWRDGLRVIVPVTDEAPSDGDPCEDGTDEDDYETTVFARDMAAYYDVVLFPVLAKAPNNKTCVQGLMNLLVADNPGQVIDCSVSTDNLSQLDELILALSFRNGDCNGNGIPDSCDVDDTDPDGNGKTSCDHDENGVPDECECNQDLNDDEVVDIDDLFAILAAWGPCEECPEDLDCNDMVDIDDLFAVLAAWGPCTNPGSGTPPQSIYDCWEYINDPQKFQTCIEAMTLIGAGGGQ